VNALLISPMRATCPAHVIPILGEEIEIVNTATSSYIAKFATKCGPFVKVD